MHVHAYDIKCSFLVQWKWWAKWTYFLLLTNANASYFFVYSKREKWIDMIWIIKFVHFYCFIEIYRWSWGNLLISRIHTKKTPIVKGDEVSESIKKLDVLKSKTTYRIFIWSFGCPLCILSDSMWYFRGPVRFCSNVLFFVEIFSGVSYSD